jgi:hypothetical protein
MEADTESGDGRLDDVDREMSGRVPEIERITSPLEPRAIAMIAFPGAVSSPAPKADGGRFCGQKRRK